MHEMSLMKDLVNKINQIAQAENADNITQVTIQIGALAHISADHFREHFVEIVNNTPLENTDLAIIESTDTNDPKAQDITLISIDIADN